jgi:1-deoxy-D-xylulose-5-phosphate synthase
MSGILDKIDSPSDLKVLSCEQLKLLAGEIREELVKVISVNGGHLASSLGTVELTIALHRIFNSPVDKIIWDVGHQSYAHKLLTGRKDRFSTIRQYGGLSGFPLRSESPHDAFGTGHAGTSISAALGMALARDLNKEHFNVVAVIGDGSLSAGMAFEAINHAGHLGTKLIIILNDNGVSISPSVGALSKLLNKVRTDTKYEGAKRKAKWAITRLPFGQKVWMLTKRMKSGMESVILPNAFWNQLGFTYLGPVNGHNIREMESSLLRARDMETGPTVIHVMTKKGKGNSDAEEDVVKYHGISPSNGTKSHAPSYSQVFGQTISRLMKDDKRLVVISAAMLDGTGLPHVAAEFPGRVFDVGICEQHAVTLAAGLATQGLVPIVAIYSTFLQRSYDQIIHDVCTQNLPVIFAIDRAGIVGEDGKTHNGPFDISYLRCIPGMIIAAPADEDELQHLLYSATQYGQPAAIRYPRGGGEGIGLSKEFRMIPPGKGEIVRQGKDITILAIGTTVYRALEAAALLSNEDVDCTVINARFAKPLDTGLILSQIEKNRNILTVEENTICGGFGSAVSQLLQEANISNVEIKNLGLPDHFIEHGAPELLKSMYDIDAAGISKYVKTAFPELFSRYPLKEGSISKITSDTTGPQFRA